MKIGIFDSGFGGLDILREITDRLPQYDYIYLGDTARTPYGTRSQDVIYEYTKNAVDYLFEQGCSLIILACNSSSSEALPKIQQTYLAEKYPDRRVLGVIIPAVEVAMENTKKLGVIATESTVSSGAFVREAEKINSDVTVFQKACPLLVPLVESGVTDSEIVEPIIKQCLKSLVEEGIDTLILGCTHYGILEDSIKNVAKELGSDMKILNEGKLVAEKLEDYLKRHPEMESELSKNSDRKFYTTDLTDRFQKLGSKFFGKEIEVEKVEIK